MNSQTMTEDDGAADCDSNECSTLYWVCSFIRYIRFISEAWYFSRSFATTLVGMTVLTCMLTLAISTNIVISLGMVGALSIVRYRTAIKDPMDLLYLF